MLQRMFSLTCGSSVRRLRRAVEDPIGAQNVVLRDLLSTASKTHWGKRHHFSEILRDAELIRAYQSLVPLSTYDDLLPDIQRMRQGEPDVLWPGTINDYAISSGTSASANKELPVSEALFRQFGHFAKQLILSHLIDVGNFASLRGTPVSFTSTIVNDLSRPEVRVGQVSGLVANRAKQTMLHRLFSHPLPQEIAASSSLDEKINRFADYAMDRDVRMLAMIPWLVLRFMDRLVERFNQRYDRNVSEVSEIWPNLQLVIAGGQPMSLFRDLIQERYGARKINMLEMYGASESMFALQRSVADEDLYLHPDNRVFFEFVRHAEYGRRSAKRLSVSDVEIDTHYVMYVTTCSGLWCYCMDDVVSFSSLFPHKIRVLGRASELLNTRGEAITGCHLREVLQSAAKLLNIRPIAFHVSPLSAVSGPYQLRWLIEFDESLPDLQQLARLLDDRLREKNRVYSELRADGGSAIPQVVQVPLGGFDDWVNRAAGIAHAQAKIPVLANNSTFAEEILATLSIRV